MASTSETDDVLYQFLRAGSAESSIRKSSKVLLDNTFIPKGISEYDKCLAGFSLDSDTEGAICQGL